ncbi:metallophosphoesterase, partial [bacterium]|nr:metallophosphoesterase [bacterium]
WRMISLAKMNTFGNIVSWLVVVCGIILPPITFFLFFNRKETSLSEYFAWAGFLSLGFFSFVFIFLLARDIGFIVSLGLGKIYTLAVNAFSSKTINFQADPERRRFLLYSMNLGILGLSGTLAGYGLFEARKRQNLVEIEVPIENLPESLEGFRIVQFTDLHVSATIKRNFVEMVVKQINLLKPDVIVCTGDLVDGSVDYLKNDVEPLQNLKSRYGSYFVTGNHEYYSGVESWIDEIKGLGFTVLHNENKIINHKGGKILLAGVTDFNGGNFSPNHASNPNQAIQSNSQSDAKILLAHQPRSIFEAEKAGFDLQISGHTHGGQFFPWNFFVTLQQPFVSGLNKLEKTWVYVSCGTGYWGPPLRVGAPSEITLIKLTKAKPTEGFA